MCANCVSVGICLYVVYNYANCGHFELKMDKIKKGVAQIMGEPHLTKFDAEAKSIKNGKLHINKSIAVI